MGIPRREEFPNAELIRMVGTAIIRSVRDEFGWQADCPNVAFVKILT
jgi:hypothetical protein